MVKSELSGAYVTVYPAMVEAKDKIDLTVAGELGGGFERCLPLTPRITQKATRTGSQTRRSNLFSVSVAHTNLQWIPTNSAPYSRKKIPEPSSINIAER
jgi:hypothetical protein